MFEWEVRVQAFQNSVAIAMCNRVGVEGRWICWGVYGCRCKWRDSCRQDDTEQIVYVDINLEKSGKVREKRLILGLGEKSFMYNDGGIVSKYDCLH